MTRVQFWILNLTSVLLVLLLIGHLVMAHLNSQLGKGVAEKRVFINNARQIEPILDTLSKRIARGSDADPRLKSILIKFGLNVTLEVDGKNKTYP